MSRSAYVRSFGLALSCKSPVVGALLLSVAGCSGTPEDSGDKKSERIVISSQGAALTAVENTELALKGVVDSGAFLADSVSLAETLNAIAGDSTVCETTSAPCNAADPECTAQPTEVCTTEKITPEELSEAREDLRREADDVVKFLREEVFIEANVVDNETTETQVTYRLGADVLCSDQPATLAPSDATVAPAQPSEPAPDPECVANAEKANLRIRLTQPAVSDVDMTVVAGDENFEPLVVQLHHDRIGVKLDLAEGLKTLEALGENVEEITSLTGIFQLQLVKNAPVDYSLQFGILEDVALSFEEEGEQFAYSVAKSNPAMELRVDGNTKTVSASYNYGTIQLLAPFSSFVQGYLDGDTANETLEEGTSTDVLPPEPSYEGVVELLLAGYTGKVSYTADSDTFLFTDVGLGGVTSTLKHNGNTLAALDLNPNDGRKFSASIQPQTLSDGSKSASFTLDPTIDVNLALSFSHVADQVSDLDPVLLNDKLRVWFSGETPTFAVESDHVRMVAGSFHMTSEQNPESNVDVPEGMCLVQSDATATTETEAPMERLFDVAVAACE